MNSESSKMGDGDGGRPDTEQNQKGGLCREIRVKVEDNDITDIAVEDNDPVTPMGRVFLQPSWNTVVYGIIYLRNEADEDLLRSKFAESIHCNPKFQSVVVRDKKGRKRWQKSEIDLDQHILVQELSPQDAEDETFPNRYLADMIFTRPLNEQRPLWEVHAFRMKCKDISGCFIFRVHHSVGDGISLLSYVLARCQRVDKPDLPIVLSNPIKLPNAPVHKFRVIAWLLILWRVMIFAWHTVVDVIYFVLRIAGLEDSKMPIKGNAGVEFWPKKLATAVFSIDDMRAVKNAVDGTINDVLLSILQSGFRRYLEIKCPELSKKGLIEKLRLSGISMVNTRMARETQELSKMLRGDPDARWGNDMGYVLIPLCLKKFKNPLDSVRNAKALSDRKKTSLEAYLTYKITLWIMKLVGTKIAADLHYRALSNTTFTLSNVRGPSEEIMFAGNPISSLTATVSGLPQAIALHMISYMGIAKFQIMVAKDVIPDPEVLAQCFEDSLKELKDAIPNTATASGSH